MSKDLHVYTLEAPRKTEFADFFVGLGFSLVEYVEQAGIEPSYSLWKWSAYPLAEGNLQVYCFESVYPDDNNASDFSGFFVLSGDISLTSEESAMLDITASLLLKRYGGLLWNPHRSDRKFPNVYTCGKNDSRTARNPE